MNFVIFSEIKAQERMRILQAGSPKCGNFWLYQIIQELMKAAGEDSSSFIEKQPIYKLAREWDLNYPSQASIDVLEVTDLQYAYRISSIFRMPIEDISEYLSRTHHVWTHSPVCTRSKELFQQLDKKVYIIRDPRDRAISASKYYCSEYMLKYFPQEEHDPQRYLDKNFDTLMNEWVWHVFDHLRLSTEHNIQIVFYELLLAEPKEQLNDLKDYLGLKVSDPKLEQISEEVSFRKLKKRNPKHLRRGTSGYWQDKLSEKQKKRAEVIAGPLLDFLGYNPTDSSLPTNPKGLLPEDFEDLRQKIIQSQQPLYV